MGKEEERMSLHIITHYENDIVYAMVWNTLHIYVCVYVYIRVWFSRDADRKPEGV